MTTPLGIAVIGLTASFVFAGVGTQLKKYARGEKSYLSGLEGNVTALLLYVVLVSAAGSALITLIGGWSWTTFAYVFGGMALFSLVVFVIMMKASRYR